jgi:hypothetical protein
MVAALGVSVGVAIVEERPVDRAFAHYEKIRAALSQDSTEGVAAEAASLVPLAAEVAGEAAGRAAESLASAADIKEARDRFSAVSDALVPKFMEAGVPGVQGFMCSMNNRRWAQRGATPANPYFGKSMSNCGAALKPKTGE